MTLKGLQEGVEALEVRVPKKGDLVFFHGSITEMQEGNAPMYTPELILQLLPGYQRVFDIQSGEFNILKAPPTPKSKPKK